MELYETGDASIWTDPHIREQLLAAHLDAASDAASRKPATIRKTVDWILEDGAQPGSVIDLGCGPGFYAELFAERGWAVLGVDINPASLQYARRSSQAKGLDIAYLERSYLEAFTERTFDLALCVYCDFGALTLDQQGVFLDNAARLLKPGGRLVIDVFGPSLSAGRSEGKAWTREADGGFWSERPCHVLSESRHFVDQAVWGRKETVIADGDRPKTYVLWDHYYSEQTISRRLAEHGFRVVDIATDLIARNDFASNDVLFVKATKA